MISYIASYIVDILIHNQAIEVDEEPIYQYGFEIMISTLFTCLITIITGLIFKCLIASLIYFALFVLLRSICGGYHAKTYFQCNAIYTVVTSIVLLLFKMLPIEKFRVPHYCCILLSIIITFIYAPVENENKPLDERQRKIARFLSMAMMIILSLISCLLEIKFRNSYTILIDATMLAVSISMFVTDPTRGGEQKCAK